VLTDCTKSSGPSSVNGQAIDQTTGKGVPYAVIALLSQNNNVVGAGGMLQLQTATADINGNFSFSFNYSSGNNYTVAAQALYYLNDGNAFATLSAGKNNDVKIKMVPEGFVRFYLVNVPPIDTLSFFGLADFNDDPNYTFLYKNVSFVVYGYGNTMAHFTYFLNYTGVNHSYSDSIYLKALDTVNFTINY